VDPKSRTQKKTEEAREELQNPDMGKFDRAMRALLKVSSDRLLEKAVTRNPTRKRKTRDLFGRN
jgi:hypothetical protein